MDLKEGVNSPPPLNNRESGEQKCKTFKMGGIDVSFPPGKLHLYLPPSKNIPNLILITLTFESLPSPLRQDSFPQSDVCFPY